MSIEFGCCECGKLLRVPDTSFGKQARCPACGAIQKVASPPTTPTSQPTIEAVNSAGAPNNPGAAVPQRNSPFATTVSSKNPFADGASTAATNPFASNASNPYAAPTSRAGMVSRATLEPGSSVAGPADSLAAVGGVVIIFSAIGLVIKLFQFLTGGMDQEIVFVIIATLALMVPYGIVIYGATRMKQLKNYNLAIAASILVMLPCSGCCIVGVPVGIWSLAVLCSPTVRASFH